MLRLPTGNQAVATAGGSGVDRKKQTSCAGYVTKRGHFRKSWRVRYLVLNGADLQVAYYESKTAFDTNAKAGVKGSFYLSSIEKHEYWIGTVGAKEKPYGFKMVGHAPGKGYVELDIVVDTLHDLNEWLMVAHNALEASKKLARAGMSESMGATNMLGFKTAISSQQQMTNLKTTKAASLKEALRDIEAAKAIGREACNEIVVQGEKLDHIEEDLDHIHGDLDYGDKLLNRIKSPLRYLLAGSPTRGKQKKKSHNGATGKLGQHTDTATANHEPLSDIEMLVLALGELEEQATVINTEAVKSTEQINRIEEKLTNVNGRVVAQTKTANTAITKGNLW